MVGYWHQSHAMADYDRFNLRFGDDGLRERLEESAKKNNRSLHQEIMERLKASFEAPEIEARLTALEAEVFKRKRA